MSFKYYYHIEPNGYVIGASFGMEAPPPLPDCIIMEANTPLEGDVFHPYIKYHWVRDAWEDVRSLAKIKLDKWEEIKAERESREFSTFTLSSGHVLNIDRDSQLRIQNAFFLAKEAKENSEPFSIDWTTANDQTFTLNALQVISMGKQVYTYITGLHAIARSLRNEILVATTKTQVLNIRWPY